MNAPRSNAPRYPIMGLANFGQTIPSGLDKFCGDGHLVLLYILLSRFHSRTA
jgi:hypothetical protein